MTRSRFRAQAVAARGSQPVSGAWWAAALVAGSLFVAIGARAQAPVPASPAVPPAATPNTVVPDVIAPTIPPGAGGSGTTTPQPRSENPLADTPARPLPDRDIVVTPPASGQTPVIRPPADITNTPVIRPPAQPTPQAPSTSR